MSDPQKTPVLYKRTGKVASFSLTVEEYKKLADQEFPGGIQFHPTGDTEFKRPFAHMTQRQVEASLSRATLVEGCWREADDGKKFWVTVPNGYWVCSIPAAARFR